MNFELVIGILLSVVGSLCAIILNSQRDTNKKVLTISMQVPVIMEKQSEFKSEIIKLSGDVKEIYREICKIERSILELRERNHATNNDTQKSFIQTQQLISSSVKPIEDKLTEFKELVKDHLEKSGLIDVKISALEREVERLGKVIIKT